MDQAITRLRPVYEWVRESCAKQEGDNMEAWEKQACDRDFSKPVAQIAPSEMTDPDLDAEVDRLLGR